MSVTMDLDQVEGKIKELIAGREDYLYERVPDENGYPACANWTVDEHGNRVGSCLVGKFFEAVTGLEIFGDNVQFSGSYGTVSEAQEKAGLVLSTSAARFLSSVQNAQDTGTAWGEAVVKARAYVENGE